MQRAADAMWETSSAGDIKGFLDELTRRCEVEWRRLKGREAQGSKDARSEVGVIVTARERERFVQPLLRSLIVVRCCVEFGGREEASRSSERGP